MQAGNAAGELQRNNSVTRCAHFPTSWQCCYCPSHVRQEPLSGLQQLYCLVCCSAGYAIRMMPSNNAVWMPHFLTGPQQQLRATGYCCCCRANPANPSTGLLTQQHRWGLTQPVLRMPAAIPLIVMSKASRRRWFLGSARARRSTST